MGKEGGYIPIGWIDIFLCEETGTGRLSNAVDVIHRFHIEKSRGRFIGYLIAAATFMLG